MNLSLWEFREASCDLPGALKPFHAGQELEGLSNE